MHGNNIHQQRMCNRVTFWYAPLQSIRDVAYNWMPAISRATYTLAQLMLEHQHHKTVYTTISTYSYVYGISEHESCAVFTRNHTLAHAKLFI